MFWTIIGIVTRYMIGLVVGMKTIGPRFDTICPLMKHSDLVVWGQRFYPDVVPSWFQKQNKTHLISLWYTRPNLDWPLKKYKKET